MKRKALLALPIIALVAMAIIGILPVSTISDTAEAVRLAKLDLMECHGIPEESIEVVRVEAVDWPDTSLGCPEPGQSYAQVITPGYKIILSYGEQEYQYHSDQGSRVVLCQD